MTIAAAYLTSEGVVLGADSISTITVGSGIVQLFNHSQKVFEVTDGISNKKHLAIATYGMGMLGTLSHRTLARKLFEHIKEKGIEKKQCKEKFVDIIEEQIKDLNPSTVNVGYFLGGIEDKSLLPFCFRISYSPKKEDYELQIGEARFAGQFQYFQRLYYGFDPVFVETLKNILRKQNLNFTDESFVQAVNATVQQVQTQSYKDLPIREAIDFIHAYLYATVKMYKFKIGAPICGGPIEIGFITTDKPFRWVSHKNFKSAIFEQEPEYYGHEYE
ncbi:MAG: hypothetical protein ABIH42_02765 [Planctomycetota bacterium]